ncbi:lymphocyte antigen 6 family member pge isoform X1 [Hippoglossus stenolepis]|uniref:lymphocyte antigen 6 family member pge isoform X1 n=1 Tax=Hippoglossus stenolepis TaxID=195615 RepID=UPI00159C9FB4|nr:lymphocyte antigen 6 family member pge isoform X1 [Hippoglossus stenolepis]
MRAVQYCPLLLLTLVLLTTNSEALRCFTCMGSNNEDCNRQGSKSCPSYSDACAVVVGHDSESNRDSGVMKSCSYKSFCSQANSQGYRAPGVRVNCCYSNDCNVTSFASSLQGLNYLLLLLPLLFHCFFK